MAKVDSKPILLTVVTTRIFCGEARAIVTLYTSGTILNLSPTHHTHTQVPTLQVPNPDYLHVAKSLPRADES
jgi:hypothetical protein